MGLDSRDYYRPSGYGGFSFFPPVLKNILIVNIAVYFFQMIFENINFGGVPGWYFLNRYFALNPLTGVDQAGLPYNFQIWQIFTYQFMHGGFTHILFNMFMLWMFGMEIENIMGSRKFLIFYLSCGVGAGLLQLLLPPLLFEGLAPTIGASGAVFGVMIAFAMFFPDRYVFIYFLIPVKAKYLIAFLVVIEFLSVGDQSVVAHIAHVGGALTGFTFIMIDRKNQLTAGNLFSSFRKSNGMFSSSEFKKRNKFRPAAYNEIEDAKFYDINESKKDDDAVDQEEIDRILDKISKSGYQKLSESEKKILFEASKKK
ncbi:MAG: rhomboid family intramembrane serine protease [Bacteroidota bacterium]